MKSSNRGQIRVIEAFLTVLIVFSSFALSSNLSVTDDIAKQSDLTSVGLQALAKLDSDGSLSRFIRDGDWAALRDALNLLMSIGISFDLVVYNEQMQQINSDFISNGGFSSDDIAFVEYVCASRSPVFHCYVLHLRLAVAV